ncbi:nuclear RNA export factor 2-like [Anoplophora glabripennis]|uniref:nuclear RNA export factor 2-like n=1 Tax=Anoplophora glabripennis TaxID=217634 RepID=UPI0008738BCF|nr:nuclear RNA export factor 2-like [Anoplophora glabripennis]
MKENSFLISIDSLGKNLAEKIVNECNNSNYWHKFIVKNVMLHYEDDFILRTILSFLHPVQLTPVNFTRRKKTGAIFLASNCVNAIMKLVLNDLKIPNPLNKKACIELTIIANFCPLDTFNVQLADNVRRIVQKRFGNKVINLREFHNDPELEGFCSLNDPKSLAFVMHFVINLEPKKMILSKNSIKVFSPLTLLGKHSLISIDLQENQVTTFEDLQPLKHFPALREIILEKNPICENVDQLKYVTGIKKLFPRIKIIDGIVISEMDKVPLPKNNFLCSHNAGDLAEQFLEYYFTVYDECDRSTIFNLYHENAMFSVSCRIIPGQVTEKSSRLNHYFAINRSLYSRCNATGPTDTFLFRGRKNIMQIFKALPLSYHDPYKMKTDVIYYTEKHAVIVVGGVFREGAQYFGFSRNFVLECDYKQQYCIINEQLHVYNALNDQVKNSFEKPQRIEFTCQPIPFLQEQYWQLQETFQLITKLNMEYSRRLLEEFHYDLKTSLLNFTDRFINNKIPKEAFIQNKNLKLNKKVDIPHSNEFISKTIKCKGLLSKQSVWQMLSDERLAVKAIKQGQDVEVSQLNDTKSLQWR